MLKKILWIWFHISPMYIKDYDIDGDPYFVHRKTKKAYEYWDYR